MVLLECTKGYATEENLVFMEGDVVEVSDVEEGMIHMVGKRGWCNGVEMNFTPKIVAEHFKFRSLV
jgi:hypothetical protein